MKTKLLKNTRKKYSIIEVTDIGFRPKKFDQDSLDKFGYPFYEVKEQFGYYAGYRDQVFKTERECKNYILLLVRRDYQHKMKPKVGKTKKQEQVWYVH